MSRKSYFFFFFFIFTRIHTYRYTRIRRCDFLFKEKNKKKIKKYRHVRRYSFGISGSPVTWQNSANEQTRCAVFGRRCSHTRCSGLGFWCASFLNSTSI